MRTLSLPLACRNCVFIPALSKKDVKAPNVQRGELHVPAGRCLCLELIGLAALSSRMTAGQEDFIKIIALEGVCWVT